MLEHVSVVLKEQWLMALSFYANPQTRTPMLIIWVASFGGALHASVTTFFYLEVGADEVQIGTMGFLMSLGSLILAPSFGYALDHGVRVFAPLLITATMCSLGCFWRGMATSVFDLYVGAGMLSIGVNLWTVVLLHVAHCTSRSQRSHVLSGFSVQETGLRLLGKALFPFWDYIVRRALSRMGEYNTTMFRYRIHMGICTLFCFFGTISMLVGWRALMQPEPPLDENAALSTATASTKSSTPTKATLEVAVASPEAIPPNPFHSPPRKAGASHPKHVSNIHYLAILSALLIQAWSSTVLTVLWPLVLRDRFQFAATEYGIVGFIASVCSTAAIASFPTIERHVGKMRTAASGATLASLACFLGFVMLPNLSSIFSSPHQAIAADASLDADNAEITAEDNENLAGIGFMAARRDFLAHAILAITVLSAVHTLEPSLKSIFSLTVPPSLQNRSLGFMSTLGGLGGMGGNLLGTRMFRNSKQWSSGDGTPWLSGGVLPFAVVGAVLAIAASFLWILEREESRHLHHSVEERSSSVGMCEENGCNETFTSSPTANIRMADSDTDQHHSNTGIFFPLMKRETSYEMKLD